MPPIAKASDKKAIKKLEKKPTEGKGKGEGLKKTKKSKKKDSGTDYSMYIHKMLKKYDDKVSISKDAMPVLNKLLNVCFEKIASKAGLVMSQNHMKTLTAKDMKLACELVLPGQLSAHAVKEGQVAIAKFTEAHAGKAK